MAEFHPSILVSSSLAGAETCQPDTVVTLGGNPYWQWLACDAYYINLPTKPSMTSVGVSIIDKKQQNNVGCQTKGWLHCTGAEAAKDPASSARAGRTPGKKKSAQANTRAFPSRQWLSLLAPVALSGMHHQSDHQRAMIAVEPIVALLGHLHLQNATVAPAKETLVSGDLRLKI